MTIEVIENAFPLNTLISWQNFIEKNMHWEFIGWSGEAQEPYRHWCAYPEGGEVDEIWKCMNSAIQEETGLHLTPIRSIVNLYNHGDSSWMHRDNCDYTALLFINHMWDINWGGDFLIYEEKETFCSPCIPGRLIVFSGNLLHGPRPVSREAPFPRMSLVFQCSSK